MIRKLLFAAILLAAVPARAQLFPPASTGGGGGGTAGVSSFNTRTGAVTLNNSDVTVALGPYVTSINGSSGALTGILTAGGPLGTPSSGSAANLTGLPLAGLTGLGAGVSSALAVPLNGTGGLAGAGSGGGGSGTVNSGTGPALAQYPAGTGTTIGPVTPSGDCSIAQGGAFTCTAVNGKTINLGGTLTTAANFTVAGAYTFTGTLTNNTAVTFPTSGTLISTANLSVFPAVGQTVPICGNSSNQSSSACGSVMAIPNGATATSQGVNDGSTKVATDYYADREVNGASVAYSATLSLPCSGGFTAFYTTLTGAATMGAPTGTCVTGRHYWWIFTQDATGGRTLSSYNSVFLFDSPNSNASPPALSTAAGAIDRLDCQYDGAHFLCHLFKTFS